MLVVGWAASLAVRPGTFAHGPVIASVMPGAMMLTKRVRPSAENVGPVNSESLSWLRAIA